MGWSGPMTFRQFMVWDWWLAEEYNHPSRADYYLMQLTNEVHLMRTGQTNSNANWKLEFEIKDQSPSEAAPPELSREEMIQIAKQRSIARLGGKVRKMKCPPNLTK